MIEIRGDLCHNILRQKTEPQLSFKKAKNFFEWKNDVSKKFTELFGGNKDAAAAIIDKLKTTKDKYDADFDVVKWIANLYDRDTGAFYYSNSARNYTGYLPDLISTDKALDIMDMILECEGMTVSDFLGDEEIDKLVSFTKSLQKEDGALLPASSIAMPLSRSTEKAVYNKNAFQINSLNAELYFLVLQTYLLFTSKSVQFS